MDKIFPILLFAFLIGDESTIYLTTEGWGKSNKLKDVFKDLKPDMDEFNNKVSMLLHPDKFVVKHAFKIIDTTRIENIINDSLMSKITMLENRYFEGLDSEMIFSFYKLSDSGDYYEILTTWYAIEINVDDTIELDNQIQDMVWMALEAATGLEKEFDPDLLIFNSVDINKLKYSNKNISLNREDIYDNSWAVIIGIDKYKYSDQLNYAVKDAEAVKDMLINKFDYPEENIRYLVDEEATLSDIKLNLGEIATSAGEDDRILVFYSGHGETLKGTDDSETGYIVPYEGKMENLYATGLAMDDILRTCQLSKSKHMLFLMDACYSGLMTENVKSLSKPIEQGYLNKVANEKARQIITAGDSDEEVIERDEWQHSAFTKNLLEGLDEWEADTDEDGYVTADELGTYLRKSVTEDSDFQQTPQKGRFKNSGGGEFVFFGEINTSNKLEESPLDKLINKIGEDRVRQLLIEELSSLRCEPHCE